jgi:glycosyltransferase involved in cell wall biosynthesis
MVKVVTVIHSYNHEPFVAQAVASALDQDVDARYRVVVFDDCSTDRTSQILEAIAAAHPQRLRIVRPAVNQCSNRPFASFIRTANVEYVALLDGDDYWTSRSKLQRQVAFLDENKDCSICFHNVSVLDHETDHQTDLFNANDQPLRTGIQDLIRRNFIAGCSALIRVDAIRCLPGWYEEALFGDWPLYLIASTKGDIGFLPDVMATYRVHRGGLWSSQSKAAQLGQLIDFMQQVNEHFDYVFDPLIQDVINGWRIELDQSNLSRLT